jgi:transposase
MNSVKMSNSHKKRRGKERSNSSQKPNRGPGRPKKVKLQQMDESLPIEETAENKNMLNDKIEK